MIVFDLDGTLAELGKGIGTEYINMLLKLEQFGVRITVCSGKPTYYLCGFMRQVGLKQPILVGENGAVIQFGIDLPPVRYERIPYAGEADKSLAYIRKMIQKRFPHMWFQPNEVALTPFPQTFEEFDWIQHFLEDANLPGIDVYRHCDSFDIVPSGLDKKTGLNYLGKMLEILPEETVAVGDGTNDYPMFLYAGLSLGIAISEPTKVDKNFPCIKDALQFLLEACHAQIKN